MSDSHRGSILPLRRQPLAIDHDCLLLVHFDVGLQDVRGIAPIGEPVATLRPGQEGRFGPCVAVEQATVNALKYGHFKDGNKPNESGSYGSWAIVEWPDNPLWPISRHVLRQNGGAGGELEIHPEADFTFVAGKTYCLSCYVYYDQEYDGSPQVLHARWHYTDGTDSITHGPSSIAKRGQWYRIWVTHTLQNRTTRSNEAVGTGDGVTTTFSLQYKPVIEGSEAIYLNGVRQYTGYTIDYATGTITFDAPPAAGVSITATYQNSKSWNGSFNWYVGYPTGGTKGFRLITGLQVEEGTFPTSFVDRARANGYLVYPVQVNPQRGTVAVWVYVFSGIRDSSDRFVWSTFQEDSYRDVLALYHTRNNQWRVVCSRDDAQLTELVVDDTLSEGWHYFVVRWSPSAITLFIDGAEVASAPNPYLPASAANFYVGQGPKLSLVTNGHATMGNNYNFEWATYYTGDSYTYGACFRRANNTDAKTSEYIPVDPTHVYELRGAFKSIGTGGQSRLYFGLATYDANKNHIEHWMVHHYPNTRTILVQDLKDGDTVVYLKSVANWVVGTQGQTASNKVFAAWPASNPYPVFTYTRTGGVYYTNVDPVNNTITLASAWNKGTLPAGTPVANAYHGGTYLYTAAGAVVVPTTWTVYSGQITGEAINGGSNVFRYGTRYVRILFLLNHQQDSTYELLFDAIEFRDLTDVRLNSRLDELRVDRVDRSNQELLAWYVCDAPFYPRGVQRVAV